MENNLAVEIQKEIQDEYDKIDEKWLNLHFKITAALVVFSVFVEFLIGYIVCNSPQLNTTIPIFIFKFIIFPSSLNFICIFIDYRVLLSDKISQEKKIYIVSLLFVAICFVLFTVHIAFSALYFIFAIPIILTTIYANYKLTVTAYLLSIASIIISELFIKWDIDKVNILENTVRLADFLISLFIICAFSGVCMVVIRFEREKNKASIQKEVDRYKLERELQIDELTGIYNRKALHEAFKNMEDENTENCYIFAMIDIDNFKELNDELGHFAGDQFLIRFGKILKKNCGDAIPIRYGGDEFCILFRNYDMKDAVRICRQIQKDMQSVSLDNNYEFTLTASIGIVEYTKNMDMAGLIINTDRALYEAKTIKNTIRVYND